MSVSRRTVPAALWLVHYWWPVPMAWSLATVVHRATGRPVSSAGLSVLLLAVLAAYSFDRLGDRGRSQQPLGLRCALAAGLGGAAYGAWRILPLLPESKVLLLLGLAVPAIAYRWWKRVPWAKAILVPAIWTLAAIALPSVRGEAFPPVAVPLFLLLASGCLLCDVKDAEADAQSGVRSLPVLLGVPPSLLLAAGLAASGSAFAWWEHRNGLLACGIALAALSPCESLLSRDVVGPLVVDVLLTLPGLLIAAHLV